MENGYPTLTSELDRGCPILGPQARAAEQGPVAILARGGGGGQWLLVPGQPDVSLQKCCAVIKY
jgi:hypothetical protein